VGSRTGQKALNRVNYISGEIENLVNWESVLKALSSVKAFQQTRELTLTYPVPYALCQYGL